MAKSSLYSYRIEITQQHIDNSSKGCGNCPIALALTEFFNIKTHVGKVSFGFPNLSLSHLPLPNNAKSFVNLYDKLGKQAVQPFTLEITLTAQHIWAIDLGN